MARHPAGQGPRPPSTFAVETVLADQALPAGRVAEELGALEMATRDALAATGSTIPPPCEQENP